MPDREHKVNAIIAIGRCFNYLAVATRWSTSVITVNRQAHNVRNLGFSFTIIILA